MPTLSGSALAKIKLVTTNTPLDKASGLGGLPRGFIVEFWGENNTGKSTAAYQTVAAAQKAGLRCLWIDVEHSFRSYVANVDRTHSFGVDLDSLDVMIEENAEDYIDNTIEAMKSKKYDVIVMDSVGDLSSKIEQEKTAGEKTIGQQASIMSKFMRNIAWVIDMNDILFIVVNHQRETLMGRVYQMGGKRLAEKKKMSFRFREKQNFMIKKGERIVGKVIRINVLKNHLAPTEGLEIESNLIFQEGFSYAADLLDDAIERGIITKDGNTHYFAGEKLGMIGKVREWIKEELNAQRIKEALSV